MQSERLFEFEIDEIVPQWKVYETLDLKKHNNRAIDYSKVFGIC